MNAVHERSVHVAVAGLRQALVEAQASLTVQEGLYRAYTAHLCDLDAIDGMPSALGASIHDLICELRSVFGFDLCTGRKVAPSTLKRWRAAELLERLRAVTSSAEWLAEGSAGRRLH